MLLIIPQIRVLSTAGCDLSGLYPEIVSLPKAPSLCGPCSLCPNALRAVAVDDDILFAFTPAVDGVVFAQRVCGVIFPEEYSA